jgi:hypothetical protein
MSCRLTTSPVLDMNEASQDAALARAAPALPRRTTAEPPLLELTAQGERTVNQLVRVRAEAIRRVTDVMSARDRGALLRGAYAFTEARLTLPHHVA